MKKTHSVRQGESLSEIAQRYGFSDPMKIYNAEDNAALRKARPNPNVLHPGDRVIIPEKQTKNVDGQTQARHRFKVVRPQKKIHLLLNAPDNISLDKVRYEFRFQDPKRVAPTEVLRTGALGENGLLEEMVPAQVRRATIRLLTEPTPRTITLQIDHLDPVTEISGVQARLKNLGYDCGNIDGKFGPRTRHALCDFQASVGVAISGDLDDATRAALAREHRS